MKQKIFFFIKRDDEEIVTVSLVSIVIVDPFKYNVILVIVS